MLHKDSKQNTSEVTILVPGFNEAESIADTIKSLQNQTLPPAEIIVIDDCSTDNTGDISRKLGVTVLRPEKNTGSKAGAQNFALPQVKTKYTMAIDADTVLERDALRKLMTGFTNENITAVCGFVLPRYVKSIWERGRYIEYLFAFTFYKQVQNYFGRPLISSGCFSAYLTDRLKSVGGWSTRTMAEDMDLTWTFYEHGWGVVFVPEAVCYPIEPHDFSFLRKQLKRWSHGFFQNIAQHRRGVFRVSYLRDMVTVALWDSVIASFVFLFILPIVLIWTQSPWFLLAYVVDAPAVLIPVLVGAIKRKELGRALISFPAYFILRIVNSMFVVEAFISEWLLKRRLTTYEKGH